MKVSAIIVTRGNVDLRPVLDSLPKHWEQVVWNNSGSLDGQRATVSVRRPGDRDWRSTEETGPDRAVYGRYAAIRFASHPTIYVQDDDVIVDDPGAFTDAWDELHALNQIEHADSPAGFVVANMPERFRHEFYAHHYLVGFGAAFHRTTPGIAFAKFAANGTPSDGRWLASPPKLDSFDRTCDIVMTVLTPGVLLDVPYTDREFAHDADRMWKQPGHVAERTKALKMALRVREGIAA